MTDLFIQEPTLDFQPTEAEKRAHTPLDEDPQTWPRQILLELHRQLPEAAEYAPTVMMIHKDEERGAAVGCVEVSGEVDTALSLVGADSDAPRAYIPFIIKSHTLCPLDLLMRPGGTFVPLSSTRLREALFRPEAFAVLSKDESANSLYSTFYPPGRSDNSPGSGMSQGDTGFATVHGPGMKFASALADSAYASDMRDLIAALQDPATKLAASQNPAFVEVFAAYGELQTPEDQDRIQDAEKVASQMGGVDVLQISYSDDGTYRFKTANRGAYHPVETRCGRNAALKVAGEEMIERVDTEGPQTVANLVRVESPLDMDAEDWDTVEKPGVYRVLDVMGKEHTGWVLPDLLSLSTGEPGGMSVFTNGSVAAVQEGICGSPVSISTFNVPNDPPKGTGVFYVLTSSGPVGLEPVEIVGRENDETNSFVYVVNTLLDGERKIRLVQGLRELIVTEGEIMLPAEVRFIPVDGEIAVELLDSPESIGKTAAYFEAPSVLLHDSDGSQLRLQFENAPKLAGLWSTSHLDPAEAVFALAVAGIAPAEAVEKVGSALAGVNTTLKVSDITLYDEILGEEEKAAALKISSEIRSLRRLMVKEAAAIPDASTVDAILGLNFISSDNVRNFVQRLPYVENALNTVCELLLASRLGLSTIPENAAARAARGLDDVVRGLRTLALRKVDDD